jgi:hypothetical protein
METRPYDVQTEIKDLLSERLVKARDDQVFLLPRKIEEGIAVYQDAHVYAAKELRSSGVDASFLAEAEARTFVSEFSHDIVYQIAIGIAGNLSWDAAKAIWAYIRARCAGLAREGKTPTVRLHIARLRRGDLEIEGLTLEGPATEETPVDLLRLLVGNESGD